MAADNSRALVQKEERPNARMRLFCFTFAGSSAQVFHGWNEHAPAWLEISGFELPRTRRPPGRKAPRHL